MNTIIHILCCLIFPSRVEVYRVAVYDVSRARSTDHLLSFPACYRLLQIHTEKKWVRAESSQHTHSKTCGISLAQGSKEC